MMFLGSKKKIANEILSVVLKDRKVGEYYIEPFLGGANVGYKVANPRILSDVEINLIEFWKGLLNGRALPTVSHSQFNMLRNNKNKIKDKFILGYVGYMYSYFGLNFKAYDKIHVKQNIIGALRVRRLKEQICGLRGAEIRIADYRELKLPPPPAIIYCDPPYKKLNYYKQKFNSNAFWEWVKEKSKEGYKVFVSEYEAPNGFKEVWSKTVKRRAGVFRAKGNRLKTIKEKLFIYEP